MMDENTTLMTDAANTSEGEAAAQPADPGVTETQQGGQPQQPAGEQAQGQQQAEVKQPEGAPEKYDFTAPEGFTFDDAVIANFSEVAKELNLPQDKAQMMLDKMQPVLATRQMEQLQAASIEWANAARTDQEIGGERFHENLGVAKKAMEAYASPELRQLLNESTLGNNPEVIRLFYRVGKDMSEDRLVTGQGGTNKAADPRSLYRASNMNP